ncbi:ras-related protein Rab-44 isoform X7 [Frankliniella occidentalis]|uniref:Ras-related protein Rab-44 isoform X7 n=1 Tax=Frankliniella occidentalis TaxID=133901 RepID=A0A9C6U0K4_FRAOC|nr:ras-related protein Rab-44 isoform X7 [Frankliniella occidentalis]
MLSPFGFRLALLLLSIRNSPAILAASAADSKKRKSLQRSVDQLMDHGDGAGDGDGGGGGSGATKKRSVGSLLRISRKTKHSDSGGDSTAADSTPDLQQIPKKKSSGFLRKSKKSKESGDDSDDKQQAAVKKPSRAKALVRKLSMSRSRKGKDAVQDSSDDDRASNLSYASSTTATESAAEQFVTPSATPPPSLTPPPLTPPPMEEDEDQWDGGPQGQGAAGGGAATGPGPRAGLRAAGEPQPVSAVSLSALEAAAPPLLASLLLDDDMKGDRQHGGAIKKTPKGARATKGLVDEERKQSTRGQLLSITTPALQKQLNGAQAGGPASPARPAGSPAGPAPAAEAAAPPPAATPAPSTDEVQVVAEVGGLTPNGASTQSSPEKATNGAAAGVMTKASPPSTPPSSGDLMADARNKLSASLGVTDSAQMSGEKREHLYKILVIGELGTGKTSIIKRYVHQFFSQHYRATIGVDFALKVLNWDPATIIRLQLWDIAGQERFGNMTRVYYKEAVGAFIVFDVTRASTFDAVVKWKQDLDSKVQMADGSPIPCVLLANKCDQQKEGLVNNPPKMDEYCKEKGFTGWFETSAKENVNIEEAARALVSKILLNDKLLHGNDTKDPTKIALDPNGKANGEPPNGKSCAC